MDGAADLSDARLSYSIEELKLLIRAHYPGAQFEPSPGPDPGDIHLMVRVDVDDADDVMAVYIDRLVELQVENRFPLYVMSLPG